MVNEGGSAMLLNEITAFHLEVIQKVPPRLRLTGTDIAVDRTATRMTSSVKKILRAGARISDTPF